MSGVRRRLAEVRTAVIGLPIAPRHGVGRDLDACRSTETFKMPVDGFLVSTVGRDEAVIREYIRNQEVEDERLDQLNLWK